MSVRCWPKVGDRRKRRETVMQMMASGDDGVFHLTESLQPSTATGSNVQASKH